MSKLKRKQYEKLLEPMQEEPVAMARCNLREVDFVAFHSRTMAQNGGRSHPFAAQLPTARAIAMDGT